MGFAGTSIEDIYVAMSMALLFSFSVTYLIIPWVIKKMTKAGRVGYDVNKKDHPPVAEMGGISVVFGFIIAMTVTVGIRKLIGDESEVPALATVSVFFVAATIGIFDDIAVLRRREKAVLVIFASLPLIIAHNATTPTVIVPFLPDWDFSPSFGSYLFYWLIIVPMGITCAANAINLSAGYNGLESGEVSIVSASLIVVLIVMGVDSNHSNGGIAIGLHTVVILTALLGAVTALYLFNRFPAKTFVGDTGTLGMGAVIAAAAILGNIQAFAIICILPAFYEFFATVYYASKKIERRDACMSPKIMKDGRLKPPKGAERYTLAYYILSKKPMTEKKLVRVILFLYAGSGAIAIIIALVDKVYF